MHARRAVRQIEHVAAAEQRLGAVGVEDGARIDLGGHAERHAGREVGLDQSGDDIDRRPLRGQHQVNADGARHLRQARDGSFDVLPVEHHQVGQLVDDDDDVGQRTRVLVALRRRGWRCAIEEAVVLIDVAHALCGQHFQAALHLAYGVAQRVRGQLGFGDDGRVQVRHAFVIAQLQPLGIDQDQPHFAAASPCTGST